MITVREVHERKPRVNAGRETSFLLYLELQHRAIRANYYTSVVGDENKMWTVRNQIRELGFSPHVFKKGRREDKAKAVDVTLTKDLLANAFFNNYDVAVLIAGDGDYVPVVEELKRLGEVVYLAFYERYGLSPDLHMASDHFFEMEAMMLEKFSRPSVAGGSAPTG